MTLEDGFPKFPSAPFLIIFQLYSMNPELWKYQEAPSEKYSVQQQVPHPATAGDRGTSASVCLLGRFTCTLEKGSMTLIRFCSNKLS